MSFSWLTAMLEALGGFSRDLPRRRIQIKGMAAAFAEETTAMRLQMACEVDSLHRAAARR
jgi:hypothetical protein